MRILRRLLSEVPADLLVLLVAVTLATVVVWASASPWDAVAAGIVLLAPGYALARSLTGAGWSSGGAGVVLIALALATTALTGLVLDLLSPGLTGHAWLVALDILTAATVLLWGRRSPALDVRLARLRRPSSSAVAGGACLAVAAALAAGALMLSMSGARAQERRQAFVDLWLLPRAAGQVDVGVRSGLGDRTTFRVVLRDDKRVLRRWHGLALSFGEQWHAAVRLPKSVHGGVLLRAEVFAGSGRSPLQTIRVRTRR